MPVLVAELAVHVFGLVFHHVEEALLALELGTVEEGVEDHSRLNFRQDRRPPVAPAEGGPESVLGRFDAEVDGREHRVLTDRAGEVAVDRLGEDRLLLGARFGKLESVQPVREIIGVKTLAAIDRAQPVDNRDVVLEFGQRTQGLR